MLKSLAWPGRGQDASGDNLPPSAVAARPAARAVADAQPKGFPWVGVLPLALIPLFGTTAGGMDRILLIMEAIFLFLGVRRGIWVLGAIIVSEFTISNYLYIFSESVWISSRLVIVMASVLIVAPHIIRRPDLGPAARGMMVMALAFVALTTLADAAYADGSYVFQFFRYIVTGVTVLALLPALVTSRDDLRDLALVALTVAVASALVALLQHYHYKGAPIYQGVPHTGAISRFESWEGRSLGLSESPVYLSNVLLVMLFLLMGVLISANLSTKSRRVLGFALVILALGLYLTYTRSWSYSAALALLPTILIYRGRYRREFWLLAIMAGAIFLYYSDYQGSRYTLGPGSESSAAARPVLWSAGLNIAMDHPFLGVGHNSFLELSPEYASANPAPTGTEAKSVLGVYTPHNDFLNVWLSFGAAALFFYLAIIVLSVKNFVEAYFQTSDSFLKGVAIGGMGALLAFETNSFFHNFFDSTLTLWLLAGLSLAVVKLVNLKPTGEPQW
ncbi:MAG: O-antigen ligase family protein [Dehalococcoidia bacterium]|nr:O-antigen ligase family protein [Dehalococcoidia bacterium]